MTAFSANEDDLKLFELAIAEDLSIPQCDITTETLFANETINTTAYIISKHPEPIVLCGLGIANALFEKLTGASREIQSNFRDGETVLPGETLLKLSASAAKLLKIERVLLNFLQRLCAIATLTAQFVNRVKHTQLKILDTRKTQPGFRHLEKYAVRCGGGYNHRMGLYDAIMIKDTHIDCLGGIAKTLARLPQDIKQQVPVIVEVRDLDELKIVLSEALNKVSRVLLDNMSVEMMTSCVSLCRGKVATEASGNINLNNIGAIAACGVDYASIGKLTHSAGSIDLSMKCSFKSETSDANNYCATR